MNIPANLKYAETDEWVLVEGNIATIGISDHAQDQLSDIVFVEIAVSEGDTVKKGATCATLESVKAAADVNLPVSGKVVAIIEVLALIQPPSGMGHDLRCRLLQPAHTLTAKGNASPLGEYSGVCCGGNLLLAKSCASLVL
mgnify:CR=1 FL=1